MPQYDTERDPFSLAYESLWQLALQSERLKHIVRPGNMIRVDSHESTSPFKEEITESDLPELVLLMTSATGNLRFTSSGTRALIRYEWWLSSGQVALTNGALPLAWAVFAAMAPWPTELAPSIKWRGKSFVIRVDLTEAQFGMRDTERNRGLMGWSGIWGCEVEMNWQTSEVIQSRNLLPPLNR